MRRRQRNRTKRLTTTFMTVMHNNDNSLAGVEMAALKEDGRLLSLKEFDRVHLQPTPIKP